MDLDSFITNNIDDILENSNEFIIDKSSNSKKNNIPFKSQIQFKSNKKVQFDNSVELESNKIKYIDKSNKSNELDDPDELEYLEYNYEYFEQDQTQSDDENYDENHYENKEEIDICNKDESNEEDYTEDVISELYQTMYETNQYKSDIFDTFKNITNSELKNLENLEDLENSNTINNPDKPIKLLKDKSDNDEFENDDGYYFFNLLNIFIKYYNNKFDKNEHFFSDIKDLDKGTSTQMELFFDAVVEFKILKEKLGLSSDECMGIIYSDSDTENVLDLFDKYQNQIYMLETKSNKLISPSLMICLNWIYQNNLVNSQWQIYNLRNF